MRPPFREAAPQLATDLLFALVEAGFLSSEFDFPSSMLPCAQLMRRYRERPMAFAEACSVGMAELRPEAVVWTLGARLPIYRKQAQQKLSLQAPW